MDSRDALRLYHLHGFYTINHQVNAEKVKFEQLIPEVFDYVFHGKGSAPHVAKASGIDIKLVKEMRDEFLYWYPVDLRNSAKELIPNHLTFFAFQHAALFTRERVAEGVQRQRHDPDRGSEDEQIEGRLRHVEAGSRAVWGGRPQGHARTRRRRHGRRRLEVEERRGHEGKVDSLSLFIEKGLRDAVKREPDHLDGWLTSVMRRRIERPRYRSRT